MIDKLNDPQIARTYQQSLFKATNLPYNTIVQTVNRLIGNDRHYHNFNHILEMWCWYVDLVTPMRSKGIDDDEHIACAILFHDAVYDAKAKPGENEENSANLWLKVYPDNPNYTVFNLIRATADHTDRNEDELTNIFLDLDLLRLAVNEPTFIKNNNDLRAEYSHLSDLEWMQGSLKFLLHLQTQPRIYHAPCFIDSYFEAKARVNLRNRIAQLRRDIVENFSEGLS